MKLKDWPQNSKSKAPSSKSENNQYLSLQMRLTDWPQDFDSNAPSSQCGNNQYRSDKSNVPTSKSSNNNNNHNLALRMKLGEGPASK